LSTFHNLGIALWSGPKFTQFARFSKRNVKCIDFSPRDNYLVTYSPSNEANQKTLVVWYILTGEEKRAFLPNENCTWPMFRWSHDDKYLARVGKDILSVYETPVSSRSNQAMSCITFDIKYCYHCFEILTRLLLLVIRSVEYEELQDSRNQRFQLVSNGQYYRILGARVSGCPSQSSFAQNSQVSFFFFLFDSRSCHSSHSWKKMIFY